MKATQRTSLWQLARGPLYAWAALCALLAATTAFAYVPLGWGNLATSLVIAVLKAAIIAVVFMELRSATGLVRLAALTGCLWLFFLFFLMSADYLSR